MNGNEFLRRLNRLGRARGVEVRIDEERGKGSHTTIYFGDRFTVMKDRRKEIGRGLLHGMLRQLGLNERDLSSRNSDERHAVHLSGTAGAR